MTTLGIPPRPLPPLPPPVRAYVDATNTGDLAALVSAFSETATVNDQLVEYRGRTQICAWAERDVIGAHLTMYVIGAEQNDGQIVVTAHVDGSFDHRGLPDPLVLTFYFSLSASAIAQLIILRNLAQT